MIEKQLLHAYFDYCMFQKKLDKKTLKAYKIDMNQFFLFVEEHHHSTITRSTIESYIEHMGKRFKTSSIKRKYASIKTYFSYLEYMEHIDKNPFNKIRLRLKEESTLPRIFPMSTLELLLIDSYNEEQKANLSDYQKFITSRNTAILELLFSTGIRVSELCDLSLKHTNLATQQILIKGKGAKERLLFLSNTEVLSAIEKYLVYRNLRLTTCENLFLNRKNARLSDQSVRAIIKNTANRSGLSQHITPHMFRHTLATTLLDEGVDCRYIQNILGHSSIRTTERYTHVSLEMQKKVLLNKHPRHGLTFLR
ncbi:tyrosine-type recombinase/integrase [Candidatus Enterococcus clewellii]|uniref:Integrase/recombinase XerD n=2 Tax=Candidatus Enterococcus clewellii TaxID=1834193 RepID=A0AAQ3XZT1_9ENTE